MINLKLYLKNTLCIILVLSILFNISFVYAGWLSDWYSNTQVTAPGVLKTQEAGYLIGGSFTFKTKLRSDYLFSIEAPRINIGCGGIDIFLGSFRYLEPKYLIEKAKRIIQAAPYFAFQLALSVLCEKCTQILAFIESMINFLNSLQLDECKAAKAIVAMGADAIQNPERFVDTVKSNIQSGIEDLWNEAASRSNNQGVGDWVGLLKESFGLKNSLAGDIAKCLESSLNDGNPCYILDLYYERYPDTSNIIPKGVLRAYVGDIYILAHKGSNASSFGILYPDSKLEPVNILQFKTKEGKIVNSGNGKPGNIKSDNE
ncbi:MAG: conjugal transfer protein TraH, partial [Minisyncoccia bacterium]